MIISINIFWLVLFAVCGYWICCFYRSEVNKLENANFILISKDELKLRLIDYKGKELFSSIIACGKNPGNKKKKGDLKTPEGVFQVVEIQDASMWTHDFKDGKGIIRNAYGPYFIRLKTPGHKGIGIHGTHDSLSIGTRVTEGCIRLQNNDLERLVTLIKLPVIVVITPSKEDVGAVE